MSPDWSFLEKQGDSQERGRSSAGQSHAGRGSWPRQSSLITRACCLFTVRGKGEKVILSLLGLRKMEMWASLTDSETQEFVLRFSEHCKENSTLDWRVSWTSIFLETKNQSQRSWTGRSQKVSANGVCHKCGQVMEENLPVNTSEWGTDMHYVMIVLMTLKVKGKKATATGNEIWFNNVFHCGFL